MKIFYLDEAGDLQGLPSKPTANTDQPVFVQSGLFVDYAPLDTLTQDFLTLKKRFYPGLNYRGASYLDAILPEIKGADVRRNMISSGRNQPRHVLGFLDHICTLLESNRVKIVARILVKLLGHHLKSVPV